MTVICVALWISTSVILISTTTTEGRQKNGTSNDTEIYHNEGRAVDLGEFPFLAFLEIDMSEDDDVAYCSGSITSRTTVLTSAHCDEGSITAYSGLVNSTALHLKRGEIQGRRVVSVVKPHFPKFYDIMICSINESWEWTSHVAPVVLQLGDINLQPSFVVSCHVLSFRQTSSKGDVGVARLIPQLLGSGSQCKVLHPILWFVTFWMCSVNVENKTMCLGDSGGPAMCKDEDIEKQWAVNMGISPTDKPCLTQKKASVYVATAYFRNWILDNIKDLPSGAGCVPCWTSKILINKAVTYPTLWLLVSLAVEYLYTL